MPLSVFYNQNKRASQAIVLNNVLLIGLGGVLGVVGKLFQKFSYSLMSLNKLFTIKWNPKR